MKAIEDYLETKKGLWSPTTVRSARPKLTRCLKLTDGEIDPRAVYDGLKQAGLCLYTIKSYLILLSGFERFVSNKTGTLVEDFLRENSFAFRAAYQEKIKRMTDENFADMLSKAPSAQVYNTLILIGRCGLRRSEAARAKWSDIGADGFLKVTGKGGKVRQVPINRTWLRTVVGSEEYITDNCKGCHYFLFNKTQFNFHDFRAYFATCVANHRELSIKDAQLLLGHSSLTTTQRYVRADIERAKRVLLGGAG